MGALYVAPAVLDRARRAFAGDILVRRRRPGGRCASSPTPAGSRSPATTGRRSSGMARSVGWLSMYVGLDWVHRARGGAGGARRRTGWRRSRASTVLTPREPDGHPRLLPRSTAGPPRRRSTSSPGALRDLPDRSRASTRCGSASASGPPRTSSSASSTRSSCSPAHAGDASRRGGRLTILGARRDRDAPPIRRGTGRRRSLGSRSAGASSGTRRARSSGRSSSLLVVAVVLGLGYLAYDVALARGATLPGGDLRVLALAVVRGRGPRRRDARDVAHRAPADAARGRAARGPPGARRSGFFAAVPIAYLVLVVVSQILRAVARYGACVAGRSLRRPLVRMHRGHARGPRASSPSVPFRAIVARLSSGRRRRHRGGPVDPPRIARVLEEQHMSRAEAVWGAGLCPAPAADRGRRRDRSTPTIFHSSSCATPDEHERLRGDRCPSRVSLADRRRPSRTDEAASGTSAGPCISAGRLFRLQRLAGKPSRRAPLTAARSPGSSSDGRPAPARCSILPAGGSSSAVRAAVLYTAGPWFESRLPYQPGRSAGSAEPSARGTIADERRLTRLAAVPAGTTPSSSRRHVRGDRWSRPGSGPRRAR